jgi:four helix bundle protein
MTFDFERMEVYQISLKAIDLCVAIIAKMPRGHSDHADQLKRAVKSISFNTSEGSGEFKPLEKARFYRMALRSTSEACSNIPIGNRLKIVSDEDYREAYELFTRLAQMLTKLATSVELRNVSRDRDRDRNSGSGNSGFGPRVIGPRVTGRY